MPQKVPDPGCSPDKSEEDQQQVVIELYCGSCSFTQFMHLKLQWSTWYICIDQLPQHELERKYQAWDLKAFLAQPLVIYIQQDLGNLSLQKLELWCRAFTNGCTIMNAVALHASFDCTTLSWAGACNDAEVRTAGGGQSRLQHNMTHSTLRSYALPFKMSELQYWQCW